MGDSPRHQDAAEVAAEAARSLWLPEVCFVPDLCRTLGVGERAIRGMMDRGALGPAGRLGRRRYVLRSDLLRHLSERTVEPTPRAPRALPKIDPKYLEMLKPRPRRGRKP